MFADKNKISNKKLFGLKFIFATNISIRSTLSWEKGKDPDPEPDPYLWQKHMDPTDPHADPEHWPKVPYMFCGLRFNVKDISESTAHRSQKLEDRKCTNKRADRRDTVLLRSVCRIPFRPGSKNLSLLAQIYSNKLALEPVLNSHT